MALEKTHHIYFTWLPPWTKSKEAGEGSVFCIQYLSKYLYLIVTKLISLISLANVLIKRFKNSKISSNKNNSSRKIKLLEPYQFGNPSELMAPKFAWTEPYCKTFWRQVICSLGKEFQRSGATTEEVVKASQGGLQQWLAPPYIRGELPSVLKEAVIRPLLKTTIFKSREIGEL